MYFLNSCSHSTPHPAQHCNKSLVCRAPHDAVILIINGNIQFVHPPTIIYFSVRRSRALKGYNIRGGSVSAARPAATPGHPAAALYSRHPPLDPAEILTKLSQIYLEYFMHNCCERALISSFLDWWTFRRIYLFLLCETNNNNEYNIHNRMRRREATACGVSRPGTCCPTCCCCWRRRSSRPPPCTSHHTSHYTLGAIHK